jgi:hypothetical protein
VEQGKRAIPPEVLAEASKFPGGWIYEIAPGFDPKGRVPPEAIVGAWEVSESGEPTGHFKPNPQYRPA